jgi:GH24 family phage-related lysozyme (muramidase)
MDMSQLLSGLAGLSGRNNPVEEVVEETVVEDYSPYIAHLREKEGVSYTPYRPTEKKDEPLTIGVGHTGPDVSMASIRNDEQIDKQLIEDIDIRLPAIRKQLPNFDSLPEELRVPMLGSWFRGGLSGSPRTKKLIAEGKFELAADEFLRNEEYLESKTEKGFKKGMRGIGTRMEELADALRKYGKSQGSAQGGRVERNPDNNYNTQRMI